MVKEINNELINEVRENLKLAKRTAWETAWNSNNKHEPIHFGQISDDLRDFENLIEEHGINKVARYFRKNLCSNEGQNENGKTDLGKAVNKLNSAGGTSLRALNTDIRVRRINKKILVGYQNIFYYIWQVKELLNIRPDEKDKDPKYTGGSDYRYPSFGYVYSEGERGGSYLRDRL